MNRTLAITLAGLLMTGTAIAASPVAPLLRQIEGLPPASAFQAATPDPVAALLAVQADASEPAWLRLRVFDALSEFSTDARARDFLVATLSQSKTAPAPPEVHAAVAVLLRDFPEEASAALRLALIHPDVQVRVTAGRVVQAGTNPKLQVMLAAWLDAPGTPDVQAAKALIAPPPEAKPAP